MIKTLILVKLIKPVLKALFTVGLGLALLFGITWVFMNSFVRNKSPWIVMFQSDGKGFQQISISCAKFPNIKASVVFHNIEIKREISEKIIFDSDVKKLPFGMIKAIDTTILPGKIVLEIDRHEIGISEKHLIIDKNEYNWSNISKIEMSQP